MNMRNGAHVRRVWLLAAALIVLTGVTGAIAAAPSYQVQLLPVPRTGHFSTEATSINNQGVVGVNYVNTDNNIEAAAYLCTPAQCSAIPRLHENQQFPRNYVYAVNDTGVATGISDDLMGSGFAQHAYTFDGTQLSRIPGFDQDGCGGCTLWSLGHGINASGHVAGSSQTAKHRTRGFFFRDGVMLEVGLGGHNSEALGINANDEVVGKSEVSKTGETHAFLYRNGRAKDLGSLGGGYSVASAINARGHITGWSNVTPFGLDVPFLYKKGAMTALPMLAGATDAMALALNEADWVAGRARIDALGEDHAFLYDGAAVYDLNDMLSDDDRAHWQIEKANGVNDLGQIAATGRHRDSGAIRAFLFSPVAAMNR